MRGDEKPNTEDDPGGVEDEHGFNHYAAIRASLAHEGWVSKLQGSLRRT